MAFKISLAALQISEDDKHLVPTQCTPGVRGRSRQTLHTVPEAPSACGLFLRVSSEIFIWPQQCHLLKGLYEMDIDFLSKFT